MTYPRTRAAVLLIVVTATAAAVRAGQADATDATRHLKQGDKWYRDKAWDEAIAEYDRAIRLNPKNPDAFNHRGAARAQRGEWDQAIKDYGEAIRLDPKLDTAFYNRGESLANQRKWDNAITDYTEAIRLNPRNSIYFIGRGLAQAGKGEWVKAVADYDRAIRLNPNDPLTYNNRGLAREAEMKWDEAIKDYNKAIEISPQYSTAYANRARVRIDCPNAEYRDAAKAMEDAQTACKLSVWKDPWQLEVLAAACAESGKFDEAVKWQKKAMGNAAYSKRRGSAGQDRLKWYKSKLPKS
jgi:tetratricopeptide (TPR) repeat protein